MGGLTRGMEDHLHTQQSQLCTGTTICYALDSHYFRARLAGKSISWCQVYQTSMQSARVEWRRRIIVIYGAYKGQRYLHFSRFKSSVSQCVGSPTSLPVLNKEMKYYNIILEHCEAQDTCLHIINISSSIICMKTSLSKLSVSPKFNGHLTHTESC